MKIGHNSSAGMNVEDAIKAGYLLEGMGPAPLGDSQNKTVYPTQDIEGTSVSTMGECGHFRGYPVTVDSTTDGVSLRCLSICGEKCLSRDGLPISVCPYIDDGFRVEKLVFEIKEREAA